MASLVFFKAQYDFQKHWILLMLFRILTMFLYSILSLIIRYHDWIFKAALSLPIFPSNLNGLDVHFDSRSSIFLKQERYYALVIGVFFRDISMTT